MNNRTDPYHADRRQTESRVFHPQANTPNQQSDRYRRQTIDEILASVKENSADSGRAPQMSDSQRRISGDSRSRISTSESYLPTRTQSSSKSGTSSVQQIFQYPKSETDQKPSGQKRVYTYTERSAGVKTTYQQSRGVSPAAKPARSDTQQTDTRKAPLPLKKSEPRPSATHMGRGTSGTSRYSAVKKSKRRSKSDITSARGVIAVFSAIIILVLAVNFIVPDKEKSETENRTLASMPALTFEAVKSGDFMKDFETYLSDQFVGRNTIVRLKSKADRALGKKTQNGVYIGRQDWLFEAPTVYDDKQVKGITSSMSAFCGKEKLKSAMLLAPNSTYVMSEMLPKYVTFPDQSEQIKAIKSLLPDSLTFPDLASAIKNGKQGAQMYYRTDHHWTTRAAKIAFDELMKSWGFNVSNKQYEFHTLSTDFTGTLSSSSGIYKTKDKIEMCVPPHSAGTYVLRNTNLQQKTSTLFDGTKLKQKNQYEVFFGGNFSLLEITTTTRNDKVLLVFKDSYANCLLPMLIPYFEEIVIIDPRYFTDDLSSVMDTYSFTHLLFIYNVDTFLQDNSLAGVLSDVAPTEPATAPEANQSENQPT